MEHVHFHINSGAINCALQGKTNANIITEFLVQLSNSGSSGEGEFQIHRKFSDSKK